MGNLMKALVAVTCLAVLAAITYWAWGEYQAGRERERIVKQERERATCLSFLERHNRNPSDDLEYLTGDCANRGYYSLDNRRSMASANERLARSKLPPVEVLPLPSPERQRQCRSRHEVGSAEMFACMTAP
jgi:hypothetical protein